MYVRTYNTYKYLIHMYVGQREESPDIFPDFDSIVICIVLVQLHYMYVHV